jgi:hypothetical protein
MAFNLNGFNFNQSIQDSQMTTVTEDGGRTNMYAIEPQMQVMEISVTHNEKAEKLNGRLAMLGVIAAIGA